MSTPWFQLPYASLHVSTLIHALLLIPCYYVNCTCWGRVAHCVVYTVSIVTRSRVCVAVDTSVPAVSHPMSCADIMSYQLLDTHEAEIPRNVQGDIIENLPKNLL